MKPRCIKTVSAADFRTIVQGFMTKGDSHKLLVLLMVQHQGTSQCTSRLLQSKGTVFSHFTRCGWQWHKLLGYKCWTTWQSPWCPCFYTSIPRWTETFEGIDAPLVILGDSAYPLLPWHMKPFPESRGVTTAHLTFNQQLSHAQMTVERSFGHLKGWWRWPTVPSRTVISKNWTILLWLCKPLWKNYTFVYIHCMVIQFLLFFRCCLTVSHTCRLVSSDLQIVEMLVSVVLYRWHRQGCHVSH